MSKTREDVTSLLNSHKESLQFWSISIEDSAQIAKIKAAAVKSPIDELKKLAKLIKAHTTKVGIIFNPQNLVKDANPAFTTVSKLSETIVLIISVIAQLNPVDISHLYYDTILTETKHLLGSNLIFVDELLAVLENVDELAKEEPKAENAEANGRLVAVGKIWTNCDTFIDVIDSGHIGVLTDKIKDGIALIDDGFEEFAEWCENPEEVGDDPFGFSDSEDEDDDDDEEPPVNVNGAEESDDEEASKSRDELIKYAKKWLKKIELVKLLLASFKKSLPKTTKGESIDLIYNIQQTLVSLIDKFIVDLMLDQTIDDEIETYTKQITKSSTKLAKTAIEIHKTNDKKSKWYEAWEVKFAGVGEN